MRWRALVTVTTGVVAMASLVVLVTPSPAMAKGADQATLSGPGLARPVVVDAGSTGGGEPGSGGQLATLSEDSGLFLAMFGPDSVSGSAQRLTSDRPAGPLGPRYQLSYRVPDGNPTPPTVTQDLYPSAAGGPVTYTRPGQSVFGTTTTGGWYRPPAEFAALLVTLGVPGVTTPAAAASGTAPAAVNPATAGQNNAGQNNAGQNNAGQGNAAQNNPGQDNAIDAGAAGGSAHTWYWIALAAITLAGCATVALVTHRARAAGRLAKGSDRAEDTNRPEGSRAEDSRAEDSKQPEDSRAEDSKQPEGSRAAGGNRVEGSPVVSAGERAASGE